MAMGSSLTGLRQLGKYSISEVLGEGALGLVYKGFDPHVRRTVALKTIRRKLIDGERSAALLARFRTEAHAAGRLLHPGNVAIYEWGEAGELAFLAMEYVQGVSLREHFDGGRRFALDGVVSIMVQVLDALQYAHEQGVWHRAIEPANIIIMSDGRLKVADFGIERNGSSVPAQVYMAPEQHNGGLVDSRAEIFSAGLVLYQLLTGRHPFDGEAEAIARKICHEAPVPPSRVDPERCSTRFDAVVMKALGRSSAERYQSAQVFRDELLAAYAGQGGPAAAGEAINSESAPPSTRREPSDVQQPSGELPLYPAPSQFSGPHPDPVPVRSQSERSSQSSSREPSHQTPTQFSGLFAEPGRRETLQPSETSQSSRPIPPPPTASYPDLEHPDASTVPAPGLSWDVAVLREIEHQLARYMGPIAKLLVGRAAAITTDVHMLYRLLAEQLTDRTERAMFLDGRNRLQGILPRTPAAAADPPAAGMPSPLWDTPPSRLDPSQPSFPHADHAQPDANEISAPGWDAAVLKQVERQLARIIGPVAKLMVRRAAATTTNVDELYRILADKLTERDLHSVLLYGWWNKTLEFRPREKDAISAPQADDQAQATGPVAQSKPGASAIWPPGWNGAVLAQVERQLARFVGPVAGLLVRRGAAGTTDIDNLYAALAEKLTAGYERSAFLAGRNKLLGAHSREGATPPELAAADQPSQPSSAPPLQPAPSHTPAPDSGAAPPDANRVPPGWDPAVLMQVEQQLARFVGPVAEWMVRRGATGTTDVDTLYSVLAGQLRNDEKRAAFLAGRDRLQGVPPREVDERSAWAASPETCSDHESPPAVNGDAEGQTPPSVTHEETQRPR